jgi:hypothetical protein
MSDVSQEEFRFIVAAITRRQVQVSRALDDVEDSLGKLSESVLEMANRQNTIMTALLVVAEKFDIDVEKDDEES